MIDCAWPYRKYRRHSATLDEKKDAVRTLGDILEYLKKEGITLPSKDESDLFNILNNFDFRHHNREQKKEYDKEIWYDWPILHVPRIYQHPVPEASRRIELRRLILRFNLSVTHKYKNDVEKHLGDRFA